MAAALPAGTVQVAAARVAACAGVEASLNGSSVATNVNSVTSRARRRRLPASEARTNGKLRQRAIGGSPVLYADATVSTAWTRACSRQNVSSMAGGTVRSWDSKHAQACG